MFLKQLIAILALKEMSQIGKDSNLYKIIKVNFIQ
jgi:hypothetical protein